MLLFRREMRQGGMRLIYYFTKAGAKNSKRGGSSVKRKEHTLIQQHYV